MNGNASEFNIVSLELSRSPYNIHQTDRTPLFCCHSNPLTQNYNPSYDVCTAPEGTAYRYTEVGLLYMIYIRFLYISENQLQCIPR